MTPDFKTRIEIKNCISLYSVEFYINGKMYMDKYVASAAQARRQISSLLKLFNGKYVYVIDRSWKNGTIEKYKLFQDGRKKFY